VVEDEEVGHYVEEVAGFVASGDLVGFVFDEELLLPPTPLKHRSRYETGSR